MTLRPAQGGQRFAPGRATTPLEDAEAVYWESLENWPDNGWSLFGLLQTLRAQGRTREADEVEKRFEKAWSCADITLTASRF